MIALRGATTIGADSPEEVKCAVKELLNTILSANGLLEEDLVCAVFSSTSDIHSYYPAKAAREAGLVRCPLFSAVEPDINGALRLCIRVMILAKKNLPQPKHIYLNGAANLRRDITAKYNIAIDGPAGSGKSTVSGILGKKLNILCLDTGAMYRACAIKCVRSGIDVADEKAVSRLIENIDIKVEFKDGAQTTLLDGENVSAEIRKPEIGMLASKVSALGCVREKMVALQRRIASGISCILDGRDIGTNVLPDAEFKFYLTASAEVRAKRRAAENIQKGYNTPYEEILEEIKKRDLQDKTRAVAPLKIAKDAIVIDTSEMTVSEVVSLIENKIQEKI